MKTDVWLWQLQDDYPGAGNDDTTLPIGRMWVKTHERSLFYTPQRLSQLVKIYQAQDIEVSAWCVPTGLADDAALAVNVLNTLKGEGIAEPWIQFDVEMEPGNFWQGTPKQLEDLFLAVRQRCPWANIAATFYQWDNNLFGIDRVAPLADLLVSMSYWNDFGTSPEVQLARDYQHLSFYSPNVQMGLPGNAPAQEMTRALQWVAEHTPTVPPIIWRRGTTTAENWDAIAAFTTPVVPPPKPEPCPPLSDEWVLRVGLAKKFLEGAKWAVDDGASADVFSFARQIAAEILDEIDKAGRP